MVQITNNNGVINIVAESLLTEGQLIWIKKYPKVMKSICKDFKVVYTLSSTEDGTPTIKIGKSIKDNNFDPIALSEEISQTLARILSVVDFKIDNNTVKSEDKNLEATEDMDKIENDLIERSEALLHDLSKIGIKASLFMMHDNGVLITGHISAPTMLTILKSYM